MPGGDESSVGKSTSSTVKTGGDVKIPVESIIAETLAAKVMANVFPEFVPAKDNWFAWKERIEIHFDELNIADDKQKRIM